MKIFYTEHDCQVDLENFEFNLKFHAERIQHKNKYISEQNTKIIFSKCLNNSWKPILWGLPLSHKLTQQHGSEIINTKIHWSKKKRNKQTYKFKTIHQFTNKKK